MVYDLIKRYSYHGLPFSTTAQIEQSLMQLTEWVGTSADREDFPCRASQYQNALKLLHSQGSNHCTGDSCFVDHTDLTHRNASDIWPFDGGNDVNCVFWTLTTSKTTHYSSPFGIYLVQIPKFNLNIHIQRIKFSVPK